MLFSYNWEPGGFLCENKAENTVHLVHDCFLLRVPPILLVRKERRQENSHVVKLSKAVLKELEHRRLMFCLDQARRHKIGQTGLHLAESAAQQLSVLRLLSSSSQVATVWIWSRFSRTCRDSMYAVMPMTPGSDVSPFAAGSHTKVDTSPVKAFFLGC